MQHPRLRGDDFFSLVDEFMQAVKHRWPKCLVQFEVSAVLIVDRLHICTLIQRLYPVQ
jgi:hypothetical protein